MKRHCQRVSAVFSAKRRMHCAIRGIILRTSLLAALAFLACPPPSHGQGDEPPAAPLRFSGNANWVPYQFLDENDKPDGFSVDLAKVLCRQLKRRITIALCRGWADAQKYVTEGTADAVLGFEETSWREADFDFSQPVLKLKSVIAVFGKGARINSLHDLYGTSIAVASGSPAYSELSRDVRFNIISVGDELEGLRRLVAREVKAFVGDELSIRYAVRRHRIEGVRIVGRPLLELDYVIGVKKGNAQLRDEIDAGLVMLEQKGAIDRLITKWFGTEITVEILPPWVKWAAAVGLAVIVLVGAAFVLMLVFNEKLQEQVKSRTVALEQANRDLKREIEERARVEEELRRSEGRYRTIVEQIPAVTYVAAVDKESTTLFVSPQIEGLIGFTAEEYRDSPDIWLKQLHPDDRARVLEEVRRCHESGGPFASEYRMIARDGRTVWVRDEAKIVCGSDGVPLFLKGVMFEIASPSKAG